MLNCVYVCIVVEQMVQDVLSSSWAVIRVRVGVVRNANEESELLADPRVRLSPVVDIAWRDLCCTVREYWYGSSSSQDLSKRAPHCHVL
jgi:hypothetical protein